MYHIGDRIAHPMHGAGIIESEVTQRIGGENRRYFSVRLTYGSMTVLVPCDACEKIGVRPIVSDPELEHLLAEMPTVSIESSANWNQRYRDNMLHIKSGDLREVAGVIKCLILRDRARGLSTGERKMLTSARQIVVSEIMLVKSVGQEEAEALLDRHLF